MIVNRQDIYWCKWRKMPYPVYYPWNFDLCNSVYACDGCNKIFKTKEEYLKEHIFLTKVGIDDKLI